MARGQAISLLQNKLYSHPGFIEMGQGLFQIA
jgi:hypothetical protein